MTSCPVLVSSNVHKHATGHLTFVSCRSCARVARLLNPSFYLLLKLDGHCGERTGAASKGTRRPAGHACHPAGNESPDPVLPSLQTDRVNGGKGTGLKAHFVWRSGLRCDLCDCAGHCSARDIVARVLYTRWPRLKQSAYPRDWRCGCGCGGRQDARHKYCVMRFSERESACLDVCVCLCACVFLPLSLYGRPKDGDGWCGMEIFSLL